MGFKVKFWGVRGSIPAPMTEAEFLMTLESLAEQCQKDLHKYASASDLLNYIKGDIRKGKIVHGGNTSCVEVIAGPPMGNYVRTRFVLDMGTGVRPLGDSLMKEMFKSGGLDINFLISHVHWDHIQGLPFFTPLYMNKRDGIENRWSFYGGTKWQSEAEVCIAGQMDPPNFPISWSEIEKQTFSIKHHDICDKLSMEIGAVKVTSRKLNHPQETYGWRLEHDSKVVVYATDQEPFDPLYPHPSLVALAKDADLLITDCQYSDHVYHGNGGGPARYGWGHSYPSAVAQAAAKANVKSVALFHHDPSATRLDIEARVAETKEALNRIGHSCEVFAAWEGLEMSI